MKTFRHFANEEEKRVISLDDLAKGVVLLKSGNLDVITLVCRKCSPLSGGVVEMIYLSNGVSRSYATFEMELQRIGDDWHFQITENEVPKKINSMNMIGWGLLGKAVGIKQVLVGFYPESRDKNWDQ